MNVSETRHFPVMVAVLIAGIALWIGACAANPSGPTARQTDHTATGPKTTIFVVSNGWHSGVVIGSDALPQDRIPETADFPKARFFEFGWGDAEFYPANEVTAGMTLRAALAPTAAVVHVAGLAVPPERRYPNADVIPLTVDTTGVAKLMDYIHRSFARDNKTRTMATGPGLYRDSRFYPAKGRFHLFNTCNTWTAGALVAAGFTGIDRHTTQADSLMRQIRVLEK